MILTHVDLIEKLLKYVPGKGNQDVRDAAVKERRQQDAKAALSGADK
jgi:hypothetical protein